MNTIRRFGGALSLAALLGMAALPASAAVAAHTPPPAVHHTSSWHHGGGPGWHGYHHGYGFYGRWPWYFPWAYGYGLTFYGTSFYDTDVTYVEMAPAGSVQPANVWYYCRDPEGYFPYVKTCPAGWQTVPMQPAPALPAPGTPPAPGAPPAPTTPPSAPASPPPPPAQ